MTRQSVWVQARFRRPLDDAGGYSLPFSNHKFSSTRFCLLQTLLWLLVYSSVSGCPATLTRLMQYRFPVASGMLCPRCVPATLTHSPSRRHRTYSQLHSSSRKEGHPCFCDSSRKSTPNKESLVRKSFNQAMQGLIPARKSRSHGVRLLP